MAKETDSNVLELPVRFGGVTFDSSASVQLVFDKADLSPAKCEKLFCARRLDVKAKAARDGEDSGQQHFEGMDAVSEVEGSADAHSYSSTSEAWKTRLYFNLNDVDIELFFALRKKSGRLLIRGVGEIPEEEQNDDSGEHDEAPGQRKLAVAWRALAIEELQDHGLRPNMARDLVAAGIKTLGDLAAFTAQGTTLDRIKGIGPKAAATIQDAAERYHRAHPEYTDEEIDPSFEVTEDE
jgi:hypothetical protein